MNGELPWWPLFVDDFIGGTVGMCQAEVGCYVLMLNSQWKSGQICAIKSEKKFIKIVCKGKLFPSVRSKFAEITIDGTVYLQNARLAQVYKEQFQQHIKFSERARAGAKARWGDATSNATSNAWGHARAMPSQNPDNRNTLVSSVGSNKQVGSRERGRAAPSTKKNGNGEVGEGGYPAGLDSENPYVRLYWARYHLVPPIRSQELIVEKVNNLMLWAELLDYWEANEHRPQSVGKMLDRYGRMERGEFDQIANGGNGGESRNTRNIRESLEWVEQQFGTPGDNRPDPDQKQARLLPPGVKRE